MLSERSIVEGGAEVIRRFTGADSKACFTFFGTCGAHGSEFALILAAKGGLNAVTNNLVPSETHMKCGIHPVDSVTKIWLWTTYTGFAVGFRMDRSAVSWTS
jgi:hypothetical protein